MIFSFGLMGLYDEAIRHFFAVEQSGLHQSELTYASVITACGNCGHLERALEFFEEMKVLEMRRGPAVYEALIRACIHCFRSDLAVWHYQQMLSANITPSPHLRLDVENAIEKKRGGSSSKNVAPADIDFE
jgi:pentatricopeptide repeat protein